MPKCGECREFPPERKFKCPLRCFGLGEPKADYGVGDCPCFHPAGEPTEGEMLDWAVEKLTKFEQLLSEEAGIDSEPWSRSAIREAMKGWKGMRKISKKDCQGCRDNFYNGNNDYGTVFFL